jgi:hypothetical protein
MVTHTDPSSTADVYAGDIAVHPRLDGSVEGGYCFHIEADAEPGTFARIANMLNIANTAPDRVTLEFNRTDGTLSMDIELNVSRATAQSIQRKLTQLTDVLYADVRARTPSKAR